MSLSALMKRLKVGARIYIGFGTVLLLLTAIAGLGYFGFADNRVRVDEYIRLSDQEIEVVNIEKQVAEMRRHISVFTADGSEEALSKATALLAEIGKQITAFRDGSKSPERRQMTDRMLELVQSFAKGLEKVADARHLRDRLLFTEMASLGTTAMDKLSQIIAAALAWHDTSNAESAVDAYQALAQGRIAVLRFAANGDPAKEEALFTAAKQAIDRFIKEANDLRNETKAAEQLKVVGEIAVIAPEYGQALGQLRTATATYNTLVGVDMRRQADEFQQLAAKLGDELQNSLTELETATYASMDTTMTTSIALSIGALVLGLLVAWFIARGITGPVVAMTGAMTKLAAGDKSVTIPALDNKDEIGSMAAAVEVFKQNAIEQERLRAEQAQEQQARERRAQRMAELVQGFDAEVAEVLQAVSSQATQMQSTSQSMSATADETNHQASAVAAASQQASANVQTVATAAEELASSIQEISRQTGESHGISKNAADQAARTQTNVRNLAQAADKIGQIVNLINDIAAQTNLLALNATIEAARAGEAGRGFAVVAGEVKSLAGQTAKATEEIASQIGAVRSEIGGTVGAIEEIVGTIGRINEISASIAAAVEEQGAATKEIARNVEQAALGTQDVSSNIEGVTQAAGQTGAAASQVFSSAQQLSTKSDDMRRFVDRFLKDVRAA